MLTSDFVVSVLKSEWNWDAIEAVGTLLTVVLGLYVLRKESQEAREGLHAQRESVRAELQAQRENLEEELRSQRKLEHETASQTLIHNQYDLCRALDLLRVDHPEVSRMLALPAESDATRWDNYHLFKRHVATILRHKSNDNITEADRAELYLQEHATALHVCNIYEQTRLQHDLAIAAKDERRMVDLQMLLDYYEKQMLRNPRLRYHWDHGVSDMMAKPTRKRYEENVNGILGDFRD